jgi:hypothetical protein
VKPVDIKLMRTIHRTIERVLRFGPMFEAIIMDRENQNPQFKFLFDNTVRVFLFEKKYDIAPSLTISSSRQNIFIIDGNYIRYYKEIQRHIGLMNHFKCLKMGPGGSHQHYL